MAGSATATTWVKATDGAGEPVRGERTVNEKEADVVRRVFRDFAAGVSPRAIAQRLNHEGIPGPSGRLWNDSTIRGHAKRGTGIVNNELYHRPADLEPAPLRQEPRDRETGVAAQPRRSSGSSPTCRSFASSTMRSGRR